MDAVCMYKKTVGDLLYAVWQQTIHSSSRFPLSILLRKQWWSGELEREWKEGLALSASKAAN